MALSILTTAEASMPTLQTSKFDKQFATTQSLLGLRRNTAKIKSW